MPALRLTTGHLDDGFAAKLSSNPLFLQSVVTVLLENHFEESLHQDILAAVGLIIPPANQLSEPMPLSEYRRQRDPKFRENVLRAYEHQCAVSGFRVALKGLYFGCEAAHIQWHACDGPDLVENGFAVEPTLHKLFDAGAWTLTDDCRILVSAEFTGENLAIERIRNLHGKHLRKPITGEPQPSVEFIRWHREPELGGVFKQPALPL